MAESRRTRFYRWVDSKEKRKKGTAPGTPNSSLKLTNHMSSSSRGKNEQESGEEQRVFLKYSPLHMEAWRNKPSTVTRGKVMQNKPSSGTWTWQLHISQHGLEKYRDVAVQDNGKQQMGFLFLRWFQQHPPQLPYLTPGGDIWEMSAFLLLKCWSTCKFEYIVVEPEEGYLNDRWDGARVVEGIYQLKIQKALESWPGQVITPPPTML